MHNKEVHMRNLYSPYSKVKKSTYIYKKYIEHLEKNDKNYYKKVDLTPADEKTLASIFPPTKLHRVKKWLHADLVLDDIDAKRRIACLRDPRFTKIYTKLVKDKEFINQWRRRCAAGGHYSGASYEKYIKSLECPKRYYPLSDPKPVSQKTGEDLITYSLLSLDQNEPNKYPYINIRDKKRVNKEVERVKIPPLIPPGGRGFSSLKNLLRGFKETFLENHQEIKDDTFLYVYKRYQEYRQSLDHHSSMSLYSGLGKGLTAWNEAKIKHQNKFPSHEQWIKILDIWLNSKDWSNDNEGGRYMPQFYNFIENDKFLVRPYHPSYDPSLQSFLQTLKSPNEVVKKENKPIAPPQRHSESPTPPDFKSYLNSFIQKDTKMTIETERYENIDLEKITKNAIKRDLPHASENLDQLIMAKPDTDPVKRAYLMHKKKFNR